MSRWKRSLGLLLVAAMMISLIPPFAVRADELEETEPVITEATTIPEETIVETEEAIPEESAEETIPESTAEQETIAEETFETEPMESVEDVVSEDAVNDSVVTSGKCGNDVYWQFDTTTGTLTLSGTGATYLYHYMDDWVSNDAPWRHLWNDILSIVIGSGITKISNCTFAGCKNATSVTIPLSLTDIGNYNFEKGYGSGLTDAYYEGSESDWYNINGISAYNNTLLNKATKHFNHVPDDPFAMNGLKISKAYENFYVFLGDPNLYNMDAPNGNSHAELSTIATFDDAAASAQIQWTSSDEEVLTIGSSTATGLPQFVGISAGSAVLTAENADEETIVFNVTVVQPNNLAVTSIYDSNQYYASGAFYSEKSSLTDSVEICVKFSNRMTMEYPCTFTKDLMGNLPEVDPITLTAVVSGTDLSFDRETYESTYTITYENAIPYGSTICDVLTLYPKDIENVVFGSTYTVTVTLESESFSQEFVDTYIFNLYDATPQRVEGHTKFATKNVDYLVSKKNHYGQNMGQLRNDLEYLWSKWSTFDFDNYYEVVMADLLIGMLDVHQMDTTFVPKVMKEWYGNYKTILSGIETVVKESYEDTFDISETVIDKLLKKSKYLTTDTIYVDDDIYIEALVILADKVTVDQLQSVFAFVDKTAQVFDVLEIGTDIAKDICAAANTLAVMNAVKEADEELKQILQDLADAIPGSNWKMREAVLDYVHYSQNFAGQALEFFETSAKTMIGIGFNSFKNIVGKSVWDWLAVKAVGWIGTISIKGATLASTSVYKTLTSAAGQATAGAVLNGVQIGLCLSDLISNSSDKASETGKIIAMSDYAPYIIQVLQTYEDQMQTQKTNGSVLLFESAFRLHQAAQSYIMEHSYNLLIVKAESILQIIRGNDEYYEVAADVMAHKRAVDKLHCCSETFFDSGKVVTTKVISIHCPVDVYVYDENGAELVRIIADTLEYEAEGILTYIRDSEKFVAMPADQSYSVKIVATDDGAMDYCVMEFDTELALDRTLQSSDIPLVTDRTFTAAVPEDANMEPESYALKYGSTTVVPAERVLLLGDVNRDGEITEADAAHIVWYMLFPNRFWVKENADVTGDQLVDFTDAAQILWHTLFPSSNPL